ncbi:hypothetical protein BDV98DRAFT_595892 [Pterulicium gracile]|uniref:Uncharacterized protein n=1 Tax=Pterulicium gracile TaxID=1884261 RepID=A0A5C3Q8K8_9AGAR|nr:hypothetical protein BDV98DRAFT_595892 [Pterula gracilis]
MPPVFEQSNCVGLQRYIDLPSTIPDIFSLRDLTLAPGSGDDPRTTYDAVFAHAPLLDVLVLDSTAPPSTPNTHWTGLSVLILSSTVPLTCVYTSPQVVLNVLSSTPNLAHLEVCFDTWCYRPGLQRFKAHVHQSHRRLTNSPILNAMGAGAEQSPLFPRLEYFILQGVEVPLAELKTMVELRLQANAFAAARTSCSTGLRKLHFTNSDAIDNNRFSIQREFKEYQ